MAKASNISVNPDPSRAHGTGTCSVLLHALQRVRGISQFTNAWYWKKLR